MKTTRLIPFIILIIVLFTACKKHIDDEFMLSVSGLSGKVVHRHTKNPISGIKVEFVEWKFNMSTFSYEENNIQTTYTDNSGEFIFDVSEIYNYRTYSVRVAYNSVYTYTCPGDISSKYMATSMVVYDSYTNFISTVNAEMSPSGIISCYINQTTWDTLNADTVIIHSPYTTQNLIRGQSSSDFFVEPCQSHLFKWYYKKDGMDSKIFSNTILLEAPPGSFLAYEITF